MITSTHVVTNALIARRRTPTPNTSTRLPEIGERPGWFTIGGFAPDVGLILLTVGAGIYFPQVRDMSRSEAMEYAFGTLFYEDPMWLVIQNTLHSPVVVGGLAVLGRLSNRPRLTAFALGCLLHALIDIPVHHDDGPLVFFPFNWDYRFESPVSYWDGDHYGNIVGPIDLAITLIGGAYLARQWFKNKTFFLTVEFRT